MHSKAYKELFEHSKKIKLLESVSQLLGWDQETYMPKAAVKARAEQCELITSLAHQERTSRAYAERLGKLVDLETGEIKGEEKAALKQWYRDYKKAMALPNEFVRSFAKLTSESLMAWQKARAESDFSLFAPYLDKILSHCRQKADYLGYEKHPYNALLDEYEPEMTVDQLDPLFADLGTHLKSLLDAISKKKAPNTKFLHGKFSHTKQMEFGKFILEKMGFDFDHGRLDLSTHPFSVAMHPTDSRITTRMHTTSVFDCISAVLHEGGHALYEMGLLPDYYGSPIGEAISLGIHESQSRFWETRIGQSYSFWKYFLPPLRKLFQTKLGNVTLDQFYHAINSVHPTYIRVEADEVTYCLHVILRYEIEKQMIAGSLSTKEIPELWNFLMDSLLGIKPKNDKEGCLQDIHWSMGGIGYFPTYALGNIYAGQLFESFAKDYPDFDQRLAKGDLLFAKTWMNTHVHQHGRAYSPSELIKHITAKKISSTPYLNYLKEKYTKLYHL